MALIRRYERPQPEPDPVPDYHPAQVELLNAQDAIDSALRELDGWLVMCGNGRPVARDALLDVRHRLNPGPVTP